MRRMKNQSKVICYIKNYCPICKRNIFTDVQLDKLDEIKTCSNKHEVVNMKKKICSELLVKKETEQ